MNKKLITALVALTLIVPTTAHAALKNQTASIPTVAILDTAIDTSLPAFKGRIVQEVCILDWTTCPNGSNFMEGAGAASMPANLININGFDHGTQMTSVLMESNPNMNVIFIKVIGNTATGGRQIAFESTVFNALNWVKANASRYNIQAVTMAQGHHNLGVAGTDYCPKTPATQSSVENLASVGIPVFFPSGNGRDYKRLDWPACIDASVSVGYVDRIGEIAANSNYDEAKLDFFAPGFFTVAGPGGLLKNISGSSAAIQSAAGSFIALKSSKPNLSMQSLIDLLKSSSKNTVGRQGTIKKLIDLNSAMNSAVIQPVQSGPTAEQIAAAKAAADKAAADKLAADKAAAKAVLQAQVNAAIAAAETQYQSELKAAQDKLAATKASWLAKLNG
jgi:hypothetical protein